MLNIKTQYTELSTKAPDVSRHTLVKSVCFNNHIISYELNENIKKQELETSQSYICWILEYLSTINYGPKGMTNPLWKHIDPLAGL